MAKNETKSDKNNGRAVVVTTSHRGVFYGFADNTDGETIILKNARLCVYWSAAMQGFMGLASIGPDKDCKIGPKVISIELRDITSVIECTPAAVDKWESATFAR